MWITICLIVFGTLVLAVLAVTLGFFQYAILGFRRERVKTESKLSVWNPHQERLKEAQNWMQDHAIPMEPILSEDGLRLQAIHIPPPAGEDKGTVLAFHGFRSLAEVDFAPQAAFYHTMGYRVILPYQRAHGKSQGTYITYGNQERYDCLCWVEEINRQWGEGQPLFLAGISMGCATVLLAAGLGLPENVKGLVADCGFTSCWDILRHVGRRFYRQRTFPVLVLLRFLAKIVAKFDMKEANTLDSFSQHTLPVLFIHGKKDDFVPLSMTLANYEACRGPKTLFLVEEAAHAMSYSVDPTGYGEKVKEFLEAYEKL